MTTERVLAFICVLALLFSAASCTKQPENSKDNVSNTVNVSENTSFGTPWADSCLAENLPARAPEAKDDLYLHYNRDLLEEHAGSFYMQASAIDSAVQDHAKAVLAGEAGKGLSDGSYSQAELDQLRILYQQASDLDALKEAGISLIKPYLDNIAAAGTLKELEQVLLSEDFPFSPYIYFAVSAYDMSGKNNVFVYPQFLFGALDVPEYYQDSDDPAVQNANAGMLLQEGIYVMQDLVWLGMDYDQVSAKMQGLMDLEKSYAKYAGYNDCFLDMPFGAFGDSTENMSLDELAALCPNFPIKQTAEKFGKDASEYFSVWVKDWLPHFSSIWTEDNLELLKLFTQAKVVHECEPFLDPSVYDPVREIMGLAPMSAEENASQVCDRGFVLSQLLGKIYTADCCSKSDMARITGLAERLIASFKKLVGQTSWVSSAAKEKMLKKLDLMRICIMEPDGGYLDFSDLGLIPSESGGSLLGNYLKIKAWYNEKDNRLLAEDALAQFSWNYLNLSRISCAYESDTNSIMISPGFIASIEYSQNMSDEDLYAMAGWIIAHEISHAFDYTGAQLDAYGRGENVLDEQGINSFLALTEKLASYLDTIEVLPGVNLSGQRVKGEAAADIIGLQVTLDATEGIAGFDYEKFFESFSNYLFMSIPSRENAQLLLSDEHPLHYIRANVSAQMAERFYDTYGVREGDGMYLPESSRIVFLGK